MEEILREFLNGGIAIWSLAVLVMLSGLWILVLTGSDVMARRDGKWKPPEPPEVLWMLAPFVVAVVTLLVMGWSGSSGIENVDVAANEQDRNLEAMFAAGDVVLAIVIGGMSIAVTAAMSTTGLGVTSILRSKKKGRTDWLVAAVGPILATVAAGGLLFINVVFFAYGPEVFYVVVMAMGLLVAAAVLSLFAVRLRGGETSMGELSERLAGALMAMMCLGGAVLAGFGLQLMDGLASIEMSDPDFRPEAAGYLAEWLMDLGILTAIAVVVLIAICALVVGRGLKAGWDRKATVTVAICAFLIIPVLGVAGYTASQVSEVKNIYQQEVVEKD